jgi:hypothetical protein
MARRVTRPSKLAASNGIVAASPCSNRTFLSPAFSQRCCAFFSISAVASKATISFACREPAVDAGAAGEVEQPPAPAGPIGSAAPALVGDRRRGKGLGLRVNSSAVSDGHQLPPVSANRHLTFLLLRRSGWGLRSAPSSKSSPKGEDQSDDVRLHEYGMYQLWSAPARHCDARRHGSPAAWASARFSAASSARPSTRMP